MKGNPKPNRYNTPRRRRWVPPYFLTMLFGLVAVAVGTAWLVTGDLPNLPRISISTAPATAHMSEEGIRAELKDLKRDQERLAGEAVLLGWDKRKVDRAWALEDRIAELEEELRSRSSDRAAPPPTPIVLPPSSPSNFVGPPER